jgi:hypothetical protein
LSAPCQFEEFLKDLNAGARIGSEIAELLLEATLLNDERFFPMLESRSIEELIDVGIGQSVQTSADRFRGKRERRELAVMLDCPIPDWCR